MQWSVWRHSGNRANNAACEKIPAYIAKRLLWKYFDLHRIFNPLTPNDLYICRTAPPNSKRCILYIYSTNISTEYFKHALYSPIFFSLQNAICFIMLTCLVPVLFTFYIQGVLKLKKNNSCAKRLTYFFPTFYCLLYFLCFISPSCFLSYLLITSILLFISML